MVEDLVVTGCKDCMFCRDAGEREYLYNYECTYPNKWKIIGSSDDYDDIDFNPDWCPLTELIIIKI